MIILYYERKVNMSVLTIILGILMIIGGIVCLCTPVATTFGLMYFYMILFFVSGIILLIRSIATRRFGLEFFFAIISIILGGFMVFSPYVSFITETILIYISAVWLIVWGIVSLVDVIRTRRLVGGGLFALGLIMSILMILMGIYSFIHPVFFAEFFGVLASISFIFVGMDILLLGCYSTRRTR